MRPAVAALPDLISSADPWIKQALPLLSDSEGGGVARLLREATPGLAGATQAGKAIALPQLNRISTCTTRVLVPTSNQTINDQFSTGQPSYRDFFYWISAFAGQGQNFDGNGYFLRALPGVGGTLYKADTPQSGSQAVEKEAFTFPSAPPQGLQPQLAGRPPVKPDVRCASNPVPDINGSTAQTAAPILTPVK
jgi:hypothetical protein